jgi:membrane associated rhomboid family serine protease
MNFESSPVAIITFLVTIGFSLYAMYRNHSLYERFILHPYSIIHQRKWYQLITSGFLHADMPHLIFNMLTFYFFAFRLETIIGSIRFFIIYFGCLILSDLSTVFKQKNNYGYRAVGASGAISGVLFSYILFDPTTRLYMFFVPIGIPAPIFAILYLAYCYYASRNSQDFINHEAHLWGAVAGILLTVIQIPAVVPYFLGKIF